MNQLDMVTPLLCRMLHLAALAEVARARCAAQVKDMGERQDAACMLRLAPKME